MRCRRPRKHQHRHQHQRRKLQSSEGANRNLALKSSLNRLGHVDERGGGGANGVAEYRVHLRQTSGVCSFSETRTQASDSPTDPPGRNGCGRHHIRSRQITSHHITTHYITTYPVHNVGGRTNTPSNHSCKRHMYVRHTAIHPSVQITSGKAKKHTTAHTGYTTNEMLHRTTVKVREVAQGCGRF